MSEKKEESWLFKRLGPEKEKEIYDEIGNAILKKLGCPKASSESSFRKKFGYTILKVLERLAIPLLHVKIPDYATPEQRRQLEDTLNKMAIEWLITTKDITIESLEKKIENINLTKNNLKKESWIKKILHRK